MTVSRLIRIPRHAAANWLWIVLLVLSLFRVPVARADVVVIVNRSRQEVPFRIIQGPQSRSVQLASGRQVALPMRGPCQLHYDVSGDLVRYELDANSAYYFALDEQGWLGFYKINLGGDRETGGGSQEPASGGDLETRVLPDAAAHPRDDDLAEVPVKILVDNREPTPRKVWEARLRNRIDRISEILERECRVRLKVVAVETWDSGTKPIDFKMGFVQFQQKVDPAPVAWPLVSRAGMARRADGWIWEDAGYAAISHLDPGTDRHDERTGAGRSAVARSRSLSGCRPQSRSHLCHASHSGR